MMCLKKTFVIVVFLIFGLAELSAHHVELFARQLTESREVVEDYCSINTQTDSSFKTYQLKSRQNYPRVSVIVHEIAYFRCPQLITAGSKVKTYVLYGRLII